MQPRWHDPHPMAMLQHGGRIKVGEPAPALDAQHTGDSQDARREKPGDARESSRSI